MAIKALAWMVRAFEPPVYCYHEIVHNQLVVAALPGPSAWCSSTTWPRCRPAGPIMLSAHGSAPEVVAAARAEGGYVVDAVCPLVTKVHHEVKVRAGKGYQIVYVGHEGHEEAVGTMAVAPSRSTGSRRVEEVAALPDVRRAGGPAGPDHPAATATGATCSRPPTSGSPTCGCPGAATCASPPPTASRR